MSFDPITAGIDLGKSIINKLFRDKVDEGELKRLEMAAELAVMEDARDANSNFRAFVVEYEGAAKDYKDIPFFGPLMMIIRGVVRPLVTFAVVYFDSRFLTTMKEGTETWPEGTGQLLLWMNVIVLGFWFGERAVKNTGITEALGKMFKK